MKSILIGEVEQANTLNVCRQNVRSL